MKVVAIIQARMGSSRLPGKVLLELAGEPLLVRNVNRVRRAQMVDKIVVATTIQIVDDAISNLCAQYGWSCFRGSVEDVLDRYYQAAVAYRAEVVVRITSDRPLIEPVVIDQVVQAFLDRRPGLDYAANTLPPRTFPRGLNTEVMCFASLERAWREDRNPAWREHVTPYIYYNPRFFHIYGVVNGIDFSHMRWTVDTPEDLVLIRHIYDYFGHDRFSWHEVLNLLEQHPDWLEINRYVEQKVI